MAVQNSLAARRERPTAWIKVILQQRKVVRSNRSDGFALAKETHPTNVHIHKNAHSLALRNETKTVKVVIGTVES